LEPAGYTVRLGFAELYAVYCLPFARVFSVYVQGVAQVDRLDVYSAAGGCARGLFVEVDAVVAGAGNLTVEFVGNVEAALASSIELWTK
jgi:hypothetical protein